MLITPTSTPYEAMLPEHVSAPFESPQPVPDPPSKENAAVLLELKRRTPPAARTTN